MCSFIYLNDYTHFVSSLDAILLSKQHSHCYLLYLELVYIYEQNPNLSYKDTEMSISPIEMNWALDSAYTKFMYILQLISINCSTSVLDFGTIMRILIDSKFTNNGKITNGSSNHHFPVRTSIQHLWVCRISIIRQCSISHWTSVFVCKIQPFFYIPTDVWLRRFYCNTVRIYFIHWYLNDFDTHGSNSQYVLPV